MQEASNRPCQRDDEGKRDLLHDKELDLKHGMLMSFKLHLSENQVLHVGIFPDEETADKFAQAVKPAQKQIAEMGASELMAGL